MRPAALPSAALRALLGTLLGCLLLGSTAGVAAEAAAAPDAGLDPQYLAGLAAFKEGRLDESYTRLRAVYEKYPGNARYRNDYLVAAVASGHPSEALAIASRLDAASLPIYVLESLGLAARDDRRPALALHYYDTVLKSGEDMGARVGRDLALIDLKDASQAQSDLQVLRATHPGRVDVLEALGLAEEALRSDIGALAAAQELLAIAPTHRGALQLRYRVLLQLGAPHLASETTPPELISNVERGRAVRDERAFEFRWARDDAADAKTRAQRLDRAIAALRRDSTDASLNRATRIGLRCDLLAALVERGRFREAAREYEGLAAAGDPLEPLVTAAMVTAYEGSRQPQRAAALFQSLPPGLGLPYEVEASYVYALLDSGRYSMAVRRADDLAAREPMYRYASGPELRTPNADYVRVIVLSALARSYADRVAQGQQRIEGVLRRAPANTDARLALAEIFELRGLPRAAASICESIHRDDPMAGAPMAQLYSAQLAMADGSGAYQTLSQMRSALPVDDSALLRAERDWDVRQMPEVDIDGHLERSYGGPAGVVDSEISEYVYSSPIEHDWRAYAHLDQTVGQPAQGATSRDAGGAGVEFHSTGWLASGELLAIVHQGAYLQTHLTATPDDYWKLGTSYDIRTLDVPLAAVVVGVHADRLALNANYRTGESRDYGVEAVRQQFSDSNLRMGLSTYWHERWISGPVYKLDSRVDLDTSANTVRNANYFNPRQDYSGSIVLQNHWLQFRRGGSSLSHELDLGVGAYAQRYYATGPVELLQYLLDYDVNDRLTLKVGAGTTFRAYDGQRERIDVLQLNLVGRL